MLRRTPEIFLKHPRKIKRLGKPANISYLRHVLFNISRGTKQLLRHLHAKAHKIVVRSHAHLAFEKLSEIIVAEGYGLQVLVKLVVAVSAVLHDVALDKPHHVSERLCALEGDNIIHYQVAECLYYKLLVVYFAVEIIKRVIEGSKYICMLVKPSSLLFM